MSTSFKIETRHWTLIAALAIAAYACYGLIAPFISAIILAFIVSLLFLPIHQKIHSYFQTLPNLSATLSCVLLTFIIIIPIAFISLAILHEGITALGNIYYWITQGGIKELMASPSAQAIIKNIDKWLPFKEIDQQELIGKVAATISEFSSQMIAMSSKILGDLTGVLVNFFLMLFVLFFLLRDHEKIIQTLRHVLPLSRSQEDTLLDEVEKVAKSAVLGSFLTAIAQGIVGGFAMWLAGFAGLFWGSMMAFASFIPVVGTALIWFPAASYLFLIGEWQWGVFLAVWGILVVGSVDNLLRPLLMKGNSGMNTLLIFFSLIGGLQVYGLMGLIYGPIIFAVTLVLFHMYETEFHDFLEKQDQS